LIYRNFLYCNIAQKKNLAKPIAKIYSQGFYRNLFHIFPSVISFSTNLRILSKFLEIQAGKSIKKSVAQLWLTPAQGNSSWPRRPATRGQPKRPTGLILAGMVWCQATWPAAGKGLWCSFFGGLSTGVGWVRRWANSRWQHLTGEVGR
jgi:hypothetical protein